jgi:hypothetical protein
VSGAGLTLGLQIRQTFGALGRQIRPAGSDPICQASTHARRGFVEHAIHIASPQGLQAVGGDQDQYQ